MAGRGRRAWKSIYVPEQVHSLLKQLREKTGKPMWQLILEALSFYDRALRSSKHYTEAPDLDKAAYYAMKLATAAAYYKKEPSEESLQKLLHVVSQVEQRLGIQCPQVEPAAKKLLRKPDGRNTHTLNMATKECIKQVITMAMEKMGEQKK